MNGDLNATEYVASIRAARKSRWLGRPLHYHSTVSSTNDVLADMARAGSSAGAMVVTDHQSEGKGRLGRRWLAPAGTSLLFSLLFRPSWPAERATWLTMLAGLAALEAVESCVGLRARLKWPNDLMLPAGGQWLKVGGMLLEGQLVGGRWNAAILGIGINVNIQPEDIPETRLPATSLLKESGRLISRARLLGALLTNLEKGYEAAEQGHSPHQAWERELLTIGQQVTLGQQSPASNASRAEDHRPVVGIAVGTDEWGRLIVRDSEGGQHAVTAGDVTVQVDNSGD
jgi:BirA family biotin operon repressor/biotin-[acetyl-CoA-carboxylase] ligase